MFIEYLLFKYHWMNNSIFLDQPNKGIDYVVGVTFEHAKSFLVHEVSHST
jgi:hypothetical protein